MEVKKSKSKVYKILCVSGSVLLIIMAIFHGSGFLYISETIVQSNTEEFLKEIVPVLFAHPSIHLLGLAAFGFLALSLQKESKKVLFLLSLIVIIDGLLAFYLGGILPGVLLSIAAICFINAGYISARD